MLTVVKDNTGVAQAAENQKCINSTRQAGLGSSAQISRQAMFTFKLDKEDL